MKKVYVLAAAAMLCASASAANTSQKRSEVKAPAKVQVSNLVKADMFEGVAVEANHSQARKAAKKAQPVAGEAFYKRPAGSMFGALTSGGYLYYNPYVTVKAYAPTTFVGNELDTYTWNVQLWNGQASARQWMTANVKDIDVTYGYETDSVPSLTDGVTEFHIGGTTSAGAAGWSSIAAIPDMKEWTYDETEGYALLSPKFFGKRDGSAYATTRYSGAKDADGGTSGMWFGHNYSGWNAMGLYVEAPQNPYLLRGVSIDYVGLELAADADLYVEVYKVATRVEDDENGMDVTPGELIASGKYTFVKDDSPEESGLVEIPFVVEEGGLEYEYSPTIDSDIFVIVKGYESENFTNFSMMISYDSWDEGHGQHGYMVRAEEDGTYTKTIGLDHFFTTSLGYRAPTVFLDVVNPFMVYNYNAEEGVREFAKDGACTTTMFTGYPYANNQVSIYSYTSGEEMEFTLEDGSDLPEWITIEAEDQMEDDEFSGEVVLTVTAAENAGAPREANVKVAIPGAYLILKVSQDGDATPAVKGDVNNDGVVDVTDVNILLNIILGLDDAANYDGRADVTGEGDVDVADVNAVINIILGA